MTTGVFSRGRDDGPGAARCAQCGKPIAKNARFCGTCGAPVPQRACQTCGTANAPQAKFCAKCGRALDTTTTGPASVDPKAAMDAPLTGVVRPSTDMEEPAGRPSLAGAPSPVAPVPVQRQAKPATGRPTGVELTASPPSATERSASPPTPPAQMAPPPTTGPAVASHATDAPPSPPAGVPPESRMPPTRDAAQSIRNRRPLLPGIGALVVALLIGAGGYGYWIGIIGDRPGSIARDVIAELRQLGFDQVTVSIGKDWIARVSGAVVGQDRKQALEAALNSQPDIASINLDALEVRPSRQEILSVITRGLADNRLGHISAEVDEAGRVVLAGRAERETDIARASDVAMGVPGVAMVDPRIGKPFSVLEREINQALRASGFTGVRARVQSLEEVVVSGTLRDEGDRTTVIARVADTASGLGETIDATLIRDDMIVDVPVVVAPPPKQAQAAPTQPVPTVAFESTEPVSSTPPIVGTWSGQIRWGFVGSNAAFQVNDATVGGIVGRTEYAGSYLYCRGSLRLVDISGSEYTFEEKITEKNPRATCPGGGTVTMLLSTQGAADVKWTRSKKLSAVRYKGTLNKQ